MVELESLGSNSLVDLLSALSTVESKISLHHLLVPLVNSESISNSTVSVNVENLHGATTGGEQLLLVVFFAVVLCARVMTQVMS